MTEWKDDDEFTTTFGTLKRSMAEAAEAERERIIALLELLKGNEKVCCDECQPHADRNRHYLTAVIALIKGEKE